MTRSAVLVALGCAALACSCSSRELLHLLPGAPERSETANSSANGGPTGPGATERALAGFFSELARAPAREPRAFAVASHPGGLIGAALDRPESAAQPWRRAADVSQPPLLGGQLVVVGEGKQFTALSADTGTPLWSIPQDGARLNGVSDDGRHTALTLDDPRSGARWISLHDRSGAELWAVDAAGGIGAGLLVANALLVPWGGQFVSAIDAPTGREIGRERWATPATQVFEFDGHVFVGGPPWQIPGAPSAQRYAPPRRPLPGKVRVGPSHSERDPEPQITWLFVPAVGDSVSGNASRNAVYLASYERVVFGLDAQQGALRWVKELPGRALAAAIGGAGLVICDDQGSIQLVRASDGRTEKRVQLIQSARSFRSESLLSACSLSAGPAITTQAGSAGPAADESLVEQLSRILSLADPALGGAQRFLARELSARPEPEATRVLIELGARRSADRVLAQEAEDLLATRRNGVDFMLAALAGEGRWGSDGTLPPLGALADALAALSETRAAPLLAEQLGRPGHPPRAVARAAAALEVLASEREAALVARFFALHRTTADHPERVEAVVSAARTLLRIGGATGRRAVERALRDPLTLADVKIALQKLLDTKAAGSSPGPAATPGQPK